jgi:hypothetical protein
MQMGRLRDYFKRIAVAAGQADEGQAQSIAGKKRKKKKLVRAGSYNPALRRDYEKMLKEANDL